MFKLYLKLRMLVCNSFPAMTLDDAPLFITHNGVADNDVSRHVTSFFRNYNLHINTNGIRTLVATTTGKLINNNKKYFVSMITLAILNNVQNKSIAVAR